MYSDLLKALHARSARQASGSHLYRAAAEAIEELMEERVRLLEEIHGYCKFCKRNNDGEEPLCFQCCHFAAKELVTGDYWEWRGEKEG